MVRMFVEKIKEREETIVSGREFHHLTRVLRLKKNDNLSIFDGKGKAFRATIKNVTRKEAILKLVEPLKESKESPIKIILAQGIPKLNKMDYTIQKATELGVSEIIPVITSRTVPDLKVDRAVKRTVRFKRIALEAAKQCGRCSIPVISEIKTFKDLLSSENLPDLKLILWEEEKERYLKSILAKENSRELVCLIGPEGGFSEEEVSMALENKFVPVTLGKRVLRTETASLAFLSIIQYEWGDMGKVSS